MSLKKDVRNILDKIADLMEFNGENTFKVNAYRNGARTIGTLRGDIGAMIKDDSIKEVKGIGKGLLSVIYEYYETGKSTEYERLLKETPEGILELFLVRGIGAKKIRLMYDKLGVDSLEKLKRAAIKDKIADLKGLGPKIQEKILGEIKRIKRTAGYVLLSTALEAAESIKNELELFDTEVEAMYTGALRRRMEVMKCLEFLIVTDDETKFMDAVAKSYDYEKMDSHESFSSYSVKMNEISQVIIYITSPANKFYALFITTGSDAFLSGIQIPGKALFDTEEDIFRQSDFPYVIPEMREQEFLGASEEFKDNSDLELKDFKGFFHFHTTESDGNNTLPEMLEQIKELGFGFAVVCDHSKSAFYANGLSAERIVKQRELIDEINKDSDIRVYHGIESDILNNGDLDYDEDILKQFHFVVGSIHQNFTLPEEQMTQRIIKAVENPYTDLIAHPTGRLLLSRDAYQVDIRKVIDACAANDVAIEINANPRRLDLDWRHLYYAREKGCLIAINPDAHSVEGVADINCGIMMARKGGVKKRDVINCLSEDDFIKFINRKVKRT